MSALRTRLAAACLGLAAAAFGQATQTEMRAFPMPPAAGYLASKTFSYTGDYGYYLFPANAFAGGGNSPADYDYVRYSNPSGKRVFIYGAWGTADPGQPVWLPDRQEWGDNCFHSHSSYGVWGRWEFNIPFAKPLSGWTFLGGGSQSGVRQGTACLHSVDNSLKSIDNGRFGWGQDFLSFDFTKGTIFKDLILGVQNNTHGWGGCGAFGCREPAYFIAYTLP